MGIRRRDTAERHQVQKVEVDDARSEADEVGENRREIQVEAPAHPADDLVVCEHDFDEGLNFRNHAHHALSLFDCFLSLRMSAARPVDRC